MLRNFIYNICRLITSLRHENLSWSFIGIIKINCNVDSNAKIYSPCSVKDVTIGYGTYISQNGRIAKTTIGKFCSIGPNFLCGWGIHPIDGISTSPMFYSTRKQNGLSLSHTNKIEERVTTIIGHDVFIGANVTVLDGVTIGHGAIIGAGSVVTADIQPYTIVGGVPAKVIKYRFDVETIEKLLKISWWDWPESDLVIVEREFFDVSNFVQKYDSSAV